MWNRRRKVIKYYISKMVFVRREKNLDFRAGPDMIDVYERRDFECSKEVYERYSHEKVSCTAACYYSEKDIYTYKKDTGYEIISPKESYDMVRSLLKIPVEKVKSSSKADVSWAIKALDILIDDKNKEKRLMQAKTYMYNASYIANCVLVFDREIAKLESDKEKFENILNDISNRKYVKANKKQQEKELIDNTLVDVKISCACGGVLSHTYNPRFCGTCGENIEKLWAKTAKKMLKQTMKMSI